MQLFFSTSIDGLQMGLCFAILALGVYLSYSILDFPDLSVDGSFPLGGVCCTILMLRVGLPPLLAIPGAMVVGILAGMVTGLLHVRCRISPLLSGIIVMTGLLSVNLALTRLLTKTGQTTTIFSYRSEGLRGIFHPAFLDDLSPTARDAVTIGILFLFVLAIKLLLDLFLRTRLGYLLRATGDNASLVVSLGRDAGSYKILGLALGNGLCAVSGGLYAQLFMSYDNNSGSGKVVLALASVIIGTAVFSRMRLVKPTTAVVIGALIYSLCLNYLVLIDRDGIYLKLLNAVLFAAILIGHERLSAWREKHLGHTAHREGEKKDA
ncbi:MAG: ABC transporter permease [Clostridia bacterium]|nr:ABC transporter permease [Clostridia bacterium]